MIQTWFHLSLVHADQGSISVKNVFLQNGDETKKLDLSLPEPPFAPKIRSLFEKKFGVSPSSKKIFFFTFFFYFMLLTRANTKSVP